MAREACLLFPRELENSEFNQIWKGENGCFQLEKYWVVFQMPLQSEGDADAALGQWGLEATDTALASRDGWCCSWGLKGG